MRRGLPGASRFFAIAGLSWCCGLRSAPPPRTAAPTAESRQSASAVPERSASAPTAKTTKTAAPATDPRKERVRSCFAGLRKEFPAVRLDRLMRFYRKNNPAALNRLAASLQANPGAGRRLGRQLIEHFLDLEETRRSSPDEYARLLAIEKLEARCLELSTRTRQLRIAIEAAGRGGDAKKARRELTLVEAELRKLIDQLFTARQQNQLIAVNRLEAEVAELRKIIQQRDANRKNIVARRFRQLTGGDSVQTRRPPPPVQWDW